MATLTQGPERFFRVHSCNRLPHFSTTVVSLTLRRLASEPVVINTESPLRQMTASKPLSTAKNTAVHSCPANLGRSLPPRNLSTLPTLKCPWLPWLFRHRPCHLPSTPLEEAARECEYFTVMRHPIDRLVSAFFYCPTDHDVQNRPAKVSASSAKRTSKTRQRCWLDRE